MGGQIEDLQFQVRIAIYNIPKTWGQKFTLGANPPPHKCSLVYKYSKSIECVYVLCYGIIKVFHLIGCSGHQADQVEPDVDPSLLLPTCLCTHALLCCK